MTKLDDRLTREQEIREAVARGWCDPANSHKEMDVILAESIVREVLALRQDNSGGVWESHPAIVRLMDLGHQLWDDGLEQASKTIEESCRILSDPQESRSEVLGLLLGEARNYLEGLELANRIDTALSTEPAAPQVENERANADRGTPSAAPSPVAAAAPEPSVDYALTASDFDKYDWTKPIAAEQVGGASTPMLDSRGQNNGPLPTPASAAPEPFDTIAALEMSNLLWRIRWMIPILVFGMWATFFVVIFWPTS